MFCCASFLCKMTRNDLDLLIWSARVYRCVSVLVEPLDKHTDTHTDAHKTINMCAGLQLQHQATYFPEIGGEICWIVLMAAVWWSSDDAASHLNVRWLFRKTEIHLLGWKHLWNVYCSVLNFQKIAWPTVCKSAGAGCQQIEKLFALCRNMQDKSSHRSRI